VIYLEATIHISGYLKEAGSYTTGRSAPDETPVLMIGGFGGK
jgi:hypothetical protein